MSRKLTVLRIGTVEKKTSDWGIEYGSLQCSFTSLGADRLSFTVAKAKLTDAAIAQADDEVRLLIYDADSQGNPTGTPVVAFVGQILEGGFSDSTGSVRQNYEAHNAWLYLERTTYYQDWLSIGSGSTLACLFLNTTVINSGIELLPTYPLPNGYPINPGTQLITVGRQIADIIIWLQGLGAKIQLGQGLNDVEPKTLKLPSTQKYDIKAWEAIRVGLEKAPDVISRFDYSTTPPSIYFERRENLTAVNLTLGTDIVAASPVPRSSLVTPAVHLIFISKPEVNGAEVGSFVTHQRYPESAWDETNKRLKAEFLLAGSLTQTILIDGWKRTTQTTEFTGDLVEPMTKEWWYEFAPKLADVQHQDPADITFNLATEIKPSNYEAGNWNATGWTCRDLTSGDFIRSLVEVSTQQNPVWYRVQQGQVPQWLINDGTYSLKRVRFYAVISTKELLKKPDGNKVSQVTEKFEPLHFDCLITDCPPDSYTRETSFTPGEEIPIGLAEEIQKALSQTYYEGSVTIKEQFPTGQVSVGQVVNLLGANGETTFATMRAIVQRVTVNYDTGTTQVEFGLPRWLGVAELIDLFRISRTRIGWVAPSAMGDANQIGADDVFSAEGMPNDNMMPGNPLFVKVNASSKTVRGNGAQLDGGDDTTAPNVAVNWGGYAVAKLRAGSNTGKLELFHSDVDTEPALLTVDIDAALAKLHTLSIREIKGCDPVTGVTKYRLAIVSEEYDTPIA